MIIISGPSTIGKNPLIYHVCEHYDYKFIVPCTTRDIRYEECNHIDYHFLSKDEFKKKIHSKDMLEWDYCLSNYYGYSYFDITQDKIITHGLSRMATRIKNQYGNNITTVFLMPENKNKIFDVLKKIYVGKDLILRKELVEEEICHADLFDHVFTVKNEVFDILQDEHFLNIIKSN